MEDQRDHPAVRAAYAARVYVDRDGTTWRRGLDGWFGDDMPGVTHLLRHHDMQALIVQEHDQGLDG